MTTPTSTTPPLTISRRISRSHLSASVTDAISRRKGGGRRGSEEERGGRRRRKRRKKLIQFFWSKLSLFFPAQNKGGVDHHFRALTLESLSPSLLERATMRSTLLPSTSSASLRAMASSSSQQRGQPPSQSRTTTNRASPPPHCLCSRRSRSRSSLGVPPSAALPPDALSSLTDLAAHASVLAYERVVLPCQNMGCGDAVYRR